MYGLMTEKRDATMLEIFSKGGENDEKKNTFYLVSAGASCQH